MTLAKLLDPQNLGYLTCVLYAVMLIAFFMLYRRSAISGSQFYAYSLLSMVCLTGTTVFARLLSS
ncbi:hypothetical protein JH308_20415 [Xanthomonas campestris pv. campestris]|uniref:hypothetical protein n=1 Tax=Xanthomonas campestris TaxID=339 RepID=UPI00226AEFDE|nr:hypothetical protein [Xanthomonas campestris]MEB1349936.1 hypothetical protein [Xanthomonas campestris pv. campestris]WDK49559.1 hypothetical protein JH308_20415 [Xanthomonas campestris pv. campestris]WDK54186.1 hypothetical protein JH267_00715 [Xanthomonas campestris pv. campestris]WDL63021.1 hypothetical protein JH259_00670 [Xanthomonas campestris pv. campestris]WDL67088.1 hypothetical protein JH269_00230 [Xanthomonas campestris pv. campestris]